MEAAAQAERTLSVNKKEKKKKERGICFLYLVFLFFFVWIRFECHVAALISWVFRVSSCASTHEGCL
jgi:hypothetical protein